MLIARTLTLLLALIAHSLCAAELTLTLLDSDRQPLTQLDGAVVSLYLTQPQAQTRPTKAYSPVDIIQQQRQFRPFIQLAHTGQTVRFANLDPVAHHVYSFSGANRFELPLYKGSDNPPTHRFNQPGVVVIGCNIHDWMLAYLLVSDADYSTQSTSARAQLGELPAGRYRLELWHPALKQTLARKINLTNANTALKWVIEQPLKTVQQPQPPRGDFDRDEDY